MHLEVKVCSVAPKWMYIINRRRAKLEQMSTKDLTSNERFDLAYYMPSRECVRRTGAFYRFRTGSIPSLP